jgi:excisionase family DNA binding protein
MADVLTSGQAAGILNVSRPTVHALIARGELSAARQQRGTRFRWVIAREAVEQLAASRGERNPQSASRRLEAIEAELVSLRQVVEGRGGAQHNKDRHATANERDQLRVRVVDLTEALARMNDALELQQRADEERALVVEHLLAAATAAERADAHRRSAVSELGEAISNQHRPGNVPAH